MSEIEESVVRQVAVLARLKPDAAEVASLTRELSRIVGYIDRLNELNTDDVPPTGHPNEATNVFRADEVRASFDPELALKNAPQRDATLFMVPKVLDGEGGA
jgi:aspartyl-tRNA(Asn)/glutamyl-tRNA(Gln) amidotransferase subunit C